MKEREPNRKTLRLQKYDYSLPGAYFVTFCTYERKNTLSHIVGAIHESPVVEYTSMGHHVEAAIQSLPSHIPVIVDSYVIMPNHVHLMVLVSPSDVQRAIRESPLHCRSVLSRAVGYIKSTASKTIHRQYGSIPVWQRGYHDHVVRNSKEYDKINAYIHENPLRWELDILYNHGMEALDAAVDKVSEE